MTTPPEAPARDPGDGGPPPSRSAPHPLVDQQDRDLIAGQLAETVFASAGAGSGKTRHLVERVRNVLLGGIATIDEVAVITFTEAAAAELRDRLAEDLEGAEDRALATGRTERALRARAAIAGLDAAAVTTLHGFARRILAEHPFDAGVPPVFEVLDEARSLADLDEHWPSLLDALLADRDSATAVQWALVAGAKLDALRTLARRMGEHWDRLRTRPPRPALEPPDAAAVLEPLRGALALGGYCTDEADKLLAHLGRLEPYAEALEDAHGRGDALAVVRLLADPSPARLSCQLGRKESWNGRKPDVLALLSCADEARSRARSGALASAAAIVGDALGEQVVHTARRRQREGRLQYHDLLVLACEVVRARPGVRAALHDRYRRIFVDEFQDTDPLQAELVALIAAAPGAPVGDAAWWELETERGSLFFVGDPLQSIYGFRRADIGTFLRAREGVGARLATLVTNFRSVPGIVAWVNAVFGALVGAGDAHRQPPYTPQVTPPQVTPPEVTPPEGTSAEGTSAEGTSAGCGAAGDAPGAEPRGPAVTVLGAECELPERVDHARRAEAEDLAAFLRRAVDERRPIGAGGRPLQASDVVVLVPARSSLPSLEAAFDAADLRYRLESSSLVYAAREVQELLHVLRAVDDPSDQAAVVAALRTPGFGCGDDDLLRHRLAGGGWDYRVGADGEGEDAGGGVGPVRRGLAELRALHERRHWTPVSRLVAEVVESRHQLSTALDGRRWREEWRRLRFVMDQARQFSDGSVGALRDYLAWVEVQREEDARVTEVVLPEVDTPSIAIMTVHAAKGLEFPVVAVVGFGRDRRRVQAPAVLFGDSGMELALRASLVTPGFEAARAAAVEVEEHEQLRLLYVAVTRAQRHLVVSVHRTSRAATTVADRLAAVLGGAAPWWAPFASGPLVPDGTVEGAGAPPAARAPDALEADAGDPGTAADLETWLVERRVRLGAPPRVVAATGVRKLALDRLARGAPAGAGAAVERGAEPAEVPDDGGGPDPGPGEPAGGRAAWRRGRAGTAVGRAVHAVLQSVDLATGDGLGPLAALQAGVEGVPARAGEVAALASAALRSGVVRRAARARHWRELYVGAPVGDHVLEGFVDLVVEGTGGLEVVDYKTDSVTEDADLEGLLARYRLQGAAYACAVAITCGRPVTGCTFLFLRARRGGAEAVELEISDLGAAVAEVHAALGATPAGSAP